MKADGRIKSGIALGSLVLSASTTVHALAEAVTANNDDFEYGDEIAFISILQTVNGENIPKIKGTTDAKPSAMKLASIAEARRRKSPEGG